MQPHSQSASSFRFCPETRPQGKVWEWPGNEATASFHELWLSIYFWMATGRSVCCAAVCQMQATLVTSERYKQQLLSSRRLAVLLPLNHSVALRKWLILSFGKPLIQLKPFFFTFPVFFFFRLSNLSSASLMLSRPLSKSTTSSPSCPTPSSSVEVRAPCDWSHNTWESSNLYQTDMFRSDFT